MKKAQEKWLWLIGGGIAAYYLLKKPITSAVWHQWVGPKYFNAMNALVLRNDPAEIAQLRQTYETWSPETQHEFNDSFRKLGLRRPW